MKRLFSILCLLLMVFPISAFGWELNLHATYESNFRYFSRTGPGDLFGDALAAQRNAAPGITSIGLSGPWNGAIVPEGLSSKGSDGSYMYDRMDLYPVIKINPALSMQGIYSFQTNLNGGYFGGSNWANPPHYAGNYFPYSRTEEATNMLTSGGLRAWWINAELPIGSLKMGRRPFGFGPGWSGYHEGDTTLTALTLTIPNGPISFLVGVVLSDTGEYTDPYDSRNINKTPRTLVSSLDRNELRQWNTILAMKYDNGPFEFGYLNRAIRYKSIHAFPQPTGTLRDDMTASFAFPFFAAFQQKAKEDDPNWPIYGDAFFMTNVFYAKYTNGRFFLNGEYDFQYLAVKRQGGRPIKGYPQGWFLEGGAFAGPAKLTLAYMYRSGHDRSGGILDVAAPTGSFGTVQVGDTWNQYLILGGAHQAMEPYTFLIGYYGTGNNSYDASGYPTYLDFTGVAGRLDYALAANMNLWGSYIYARRASNTGTRWGEFTGGIGIVPLTGSNVPNNNLGQEVNVGLTWKLLEGFAWKNQFSYWKPGKWFKHAYVDYSVDKFQTDAVSGRDIRINPDRAIDSIIAFQSGFVVDL